ncbi:hypothetical protein [Actinomyces succiniciruminis]|uniref:hypothetical protein n=1 Tax=Actinomyces succiniciruminis TaxID=1522002 RepID=UPI003CC80177
MLAAATETWDRAKGRMRNRDLLLALPRGGTTTAYQVMDEGGIAESRQPAGLTPR